MSETLFAFTSWSWLWQNVGGPAVVALAFFGFVFIALVVYGMALDRGTSCVEQGAWPVPHTTSEQEDT